MLCRMRGALRSLAGARVLCALVHCKAAWGMHGPRPLAEIGRIP